MSAAAALHERSALPLDADAVRQRLDADFAFLADEQRAAVLAATSAGDLALIAGRAGSGKTALTRAIADAYGSAGARGAGRRAHRQGCRGARQRDRHRGPNAGSAPTVLGQGLGPTRRAERAPRRRGRHARHPRACRAARHRRRGRGEGHPDRRSRPTPRHRRRRRLRRATRSVPRVTYRDDPPPAGRLDARCLDRLRRRSRHRCPPGVRRAWRRPLVRRPR